MTKRKTKPATTKTKQQAQEAPNRRYFVAIAAVLIIAALAGLAGIYGIGGLSRNGAALKTDASSTNTAATCAPAVAVAQRIAPLAHGEVAAVQVAQKPLQLPPLSFRDGDGRARTLADWRGRTVLLNLWATWCIPCRQEMPALDALQARLGGSNFEVVAVNIDTRNLDRPKQWLIDNNVTRLAYYADPSSAVFQDLKSIGRAFGMPTTVLIDEAGCEIASLAGPAEWASDDAVKLIETALKK